MFPTHGVSIRPVCEDDAAAIVSLLNPIIIAGTFTAMTSPITIDEQIEFIQGLPASSLYHIAIDDETNAAVGIQDVLPQFLTDREFGGLGEISTFVALGCHRRGIGTRLMTATIAAAAARGYTRFRATIRHDNPAALSFYRKQGFQVVSECEYCIADRLLPLQISEVVPE